MPAHKVYRFFAIVAASIPLPLILLGAEEYSALSGRIVNQKGVGMPRAEVFLNIAGTEESVAATYTNDHGEFELRQLRSGDYDLAASSPFFGRLHVRSIHIKLREDVRLVPLVVKSSGPPFCATEWTELKFASEPLGHTGVIAGQVLDEDRKPVAAADVTLICPESPKCPKVQTDSAGYFRLSGIPTGNHSIRVTAPGFFQEETQDYLIQERYETVVSIYLELCSRTSCQAGLKRIPILPTCDM